MMHIIEGTRFGRYQIQRRLGRGGMADVYLAHDEKLQRTVAIKVVNVHNDDNIERFRCEIATMSALNHTHILPLFDYGEHDCWSYLVMPYIAQGTLRERLNRARSADNPQGALSLEEAGIILEQLASALHFAHRSGFVHRDVKPSNILLQYAGTPADPYRLHVYLADFGLAKQCSGGLELTATGCLIGTPEYMAPELADDRENPGSDVYALGVVLYQMVTGQLPFTGSTPLGIYWKHIREQPQHPTELNPIIPQPIEQVILRALEKDPRRRFQTVEDLSLAYNQALVVSMQAASGLLPAPVSLASLRRQAEVASSVVRTQAQFAQATWSKPLALTPHRRWSMGIVALVAFGILALASLSLGFASYGGNAWLSAALGANAQSVGNNYGGSTSGATPTHAPTTTTHKTTNTQTTKAPAAGKPAPKGKPGPGPKKGPGKEPKKGPDHGK